MALAPCEPQELPCLCETGSTEPSSCPKSWNRVIFQQLRGCQRVAVAGRRAKLRPRDRCAAGPAEFPFFSCLFSSKPPAAGNRQPFVVRKPVPGDVYQPLLGAVARSFLFLSLVFQLENFVLSPPRARPPCIAAVPWPPRVPPPVGTQRGSPRPGTGIPPVIPHQL